MNVRNLKHGFTMIELLVVIVIIGILAAALFPSVTSFLLTGKLEGMSAKGSNVVKAINTADLTGRFANKAWPKSEVSEEKPEGYKGPDIYKTFSTTAEYFTEALYLSETNSDRRARGAVLKDLDPSAISGEGVSTATGNQIKEENCAWIIAQDAESVTAKTPVFVTRNVEGTALLNLSGADPSDKFETLLTTRKPFGQDGCVVVYKDGSSKKFKSDEITGTSILEGRSDALNKVNDVEGREYKFLQGSGS